MSTTPTEQRLLRRKTQDNPSSFPDEDIDLLFEEAESLYSAYSRTVQLWAVVVARLEELWTASIPDVTYQQNETRENRTDIQKGLESRLSAARKRLDELIADEKAPAVAFGKMRKIPKAKREYPRS